MPTLRPPTREHAPARQRAKVAQPGLGGCRHARVMFVEQEEFVAGTEVRDARRRTIVALNALVPDLGARHKQHLEPPLSRAEAPVHLFAVNEKCRIKQPNLVERGAPHQDGTSGYPGDWLDFPELLIVRLVLPAMV